MAASHHAEASLFAESLCEHVDNANDFQSLLPIMREIGIDIQEIRNMIKNKIRSLDHAVIRKVAFNAMPINALLPMDTLQHILSFYPFTNIQHVSKSFKKCFHRNQKVSERLRQKIVEEYAHCFDPDVPFDEAKNKTFVVRPAGQPLMERVKSIGDDVIVCNEFMDCFSDPKLTSGDRILLQSGCYEMTNWLEIMDRNHQIIGIGKNVEIQIKDVRDSHAAMVIGGNSKVLIQNVSFKSSGGCEAADCYRTHDADYSTIGALDDSILWMDRCSLQGGVNCIEVDQNASAHFKSCQFAAEQIGICIECTSEVKDTRTMNILDCTFADHEACILTNSPLRSIGNQFPTNVGAVVAKCKSERMKELQKRLVERGTVFSKPVYCTDYRERIWG